MTADPFPRDELPGVIAELRAVMVSSNPMDYVKAFDKVERLLATLEAMAEDGERYDHVRENAIAVLTEDDKLVIRIDIPADPKEIDRVNSRDACDMTIDAARRTRDLLAAAFLAGCVGLALGMMFGIGIGEYGTRQEAIDHGAARYTCDAHGKVTFEWLGKE